MAPFAYSGSTRMDRRAAIKWMAAAAGTVAFVDASLGAAQPPRSATATGYGTDPDLTKSYKPGDVWALTLTDAQRDTARVLCDLIIPADANGPGAAAVKVHDFIDEWISAPYPGHDADRKIVLSGLAWLDAESQRRFQNDFTSLIARQRNAICDDICDAARAKPEFREPARFFGRFRDLTAGGYFTTPEGMKDVGYTGNVAVEKFTGPPPEVMRKLGLA